MLSDDQEIYTDIEKKVELRFRRRRNFAFHVVIFVVLDAALWFITDPPAREMTIQLTITLLWAGIVALHGLRLYFYEAQERALRHEIERERDWLHGEKRKNHPGLRLAEDGELVDIPAGDWDDNQKVRKQS
ncbi:MAG: 2TM domain-containing protein [Anaerolineaceae bacterium]|nr:2TM domain-containing protein [Anaerolineaceae bacterium]